MYQIDRSSAQPLYQQLVSDIQSRIRSGALPAGARLLTVRELARQLGVTRLTVHTAYSQLQAGGWVEATVGRGTFVVDQREQAAIHVELGREFSPHGMVSDMLRMSLLPGMRSLAMADADASLFPTRDFSRAIEEALAHDSAAVLRYTSSQGEPLLRTVLADLLRGRGIHTGPDEVVITSGATQGIALVARALAGPGATVLVEQPTYVGAINIFSRQQLRLVGVPVDEEGLVVEALEPLILEHNPRFLYTIPVFQNPSGVCLSPARRTALLALCQRYNLPIVEDDTYAAIAFDHLVPPALKADDPAQLVAYVSSFSKVALPGARVGYVTAPPALIKRLIALKQADDLCSPPLLQRAMALFIERGAYGSYVRRILAAYRERRDAMHEAMLQHFPAQIRWSLPSGGFSIWAALPPSVSPTNLYLAAIECGIAFALGDFFFAQPAPAPFIRLSYSAHPPAQLREIIQILGNLLHTQIHRRTYHNTTSEAFVSLV